MKITFQEQKTAEIENRQTGRRVGDRSRAQERTRAADRGCVVSRGQDGLVGRAPEKGKSLLDIQQEAAQADVGVTQDYMTLMSNTMSAEDYAKMQEEGFDFGGMDPKESVTIVDRIKAELVRSGKHVTGYTDDLDVETLTAVLGSQVLAEAVAKSFQQADIPLTEENLDLVSRAWDMARQLGPLGEGGARYLIDNGMESEIWNLYLAENSGAGNADRNAPKFYAEEVQGYYTRNGEDNSGLEEQIDRVIERSGREVNEENRRNAAWLLDQGLPLTEENLNRLEELGGLKLPADPATFAKAASEALTEGKNPIHGLLDGKGENLYEKADRLAEYYHSEEAWEKYGGDITARRQLEEIRLRMTAEVNIKLLKSGFSIDTAPMEKLVEALRRAESELAEQYFPLDGAAVEKYRELQRTDRTVAELPGLPADVLGTFAEGQSTQTLEEFHREGKTRQESYERAREGYETLMTAPRRDLGDSMRKAFGNIDELLGDMGQDTSEENRRAVRILAYNRMEINVENLEKVKEADRQVQTVVEKLTPAATLKMIRDGVNPLEKSFPELEQYFSGLPEEYREETESYSRFLYGLERNKEITQAERESYIGIYRLVRQIEKADGAAVGALVNTGAELHFSNLLSAVRSGRVKSLDAKVGDRLGTTVELVRQGASISEQIGRAFASDAQKVLTEVSYSEETTKAYYSEQLEQYRAAVAQADQESAAMLEGSGLSANADNLLAARALLEGEENLFAPGERKRRGEELWELLDRPEEFEKEYRENTEESQAQTERATVEEADTSLDVRHMQLVHKQLTVAGALARNQEFFLPVYVGDRLTRVHLTLGRGEKGAGTVEITFRSGEGSGIRGLFRFNGGSLEGILKSSGTDEVMKTARVADIFKEEAGESWDMGDVSVVTADIGFADAGKGTDAETENIELYRVAKVFIHAVQQGEVNDEN
ncbi:MAG: DUF6240 domain-containing protein [bacterium]|nr:DUF6240 domain-containing protein [bacterium]